jgi:hypothetical protein
MQVFLPQKLYIHTLQRVYTYLSTTENEFFLFRPKTNIRQENAAEYSADHEYLAQSSKHCKNVNLSNNYFLGWQLILKIYEQQKHTVHETLTMSTKWVFSRKKRAYIEIES